MHVEVQALDATGLDELRPLWLALRDHHGILTPGEPVRGDDESWARRRASYVRWLGEPGGFALVARDADGRAVGYAMVVVRDGGPTWASGRAAEVETLSVDPERRGEGIGHRLLEGVRARLADLGIAEHDVGYYVANEGAARFYAREGYEPVFVIVRKRDGQPPAGGQP